MPPSFSLALDWIPHMKWSPSNTDTPSVYYKDLPKRFGGWGGGMEVGRQLIFKSRE